MAFNLQTIEVLDGASSPKYISQATTSNTNPGVIGNPFYATVAIVDASGKFASFSNQGLLVDGSGVTQPVSGTVAVSNLPGTQPVSGTVTANAGTNLNTSALALETGGNLATLAGAVTGTVLQENLKQVGGNSTAVGAGVTTTGCQRVVLVSDETIPVSGTFFQATQPVSGTVAATQSGTWNVGVTGTPTVSLGASTVPVSGTFWQTTQPISISGTPTVSLGASTVPVSITGTPAVTVSGTPTVVVNAATTGGATPVHLISGASTNATTIKASPGQLYSIAAFNVNASPRFLKLYNSTTVTPGSGTPVQTFAIPGNANGAGLTLGIAAGMAMSSGICLSITGAMADADTTAIGAGDVCLSLTYN